MEIKTSKSESLSLRSALVAQYEKPSNLTAEQLDGLLNLQRKASWRRVYRYMSVLLLMIMFSASSIYVWDKDYKRQAFKVFAVAAIELHDEMLGEHTYRKVLHANNIDFSMVQSYFASYDLSSLGDLTLDNMEIISYDKCMLAGTEVLRIVLKDKSTGLMESFYQFSYDESSSQWFKVGTKYGENREYKFKDKVVDILLQNQKMIIKTRKSASF